MYVFLLQECLLILHSVLYKEYQSLKSKRHVEGSKSYVVTDSKNSVFGAYLNKEKSAKKKFSFSSKNTKMLSWSKQGGWTNFQKMPYNNKLPKSECREVNEVIWKEIHIYLSEQWFSREIPCTFVTKVLTLLICHLKQKKLSSNCWPSDIAILFHFTQRKNATSLSGIITN